VFRDPGRGVHVERRPGLEGDEGVPRETAGTIAMWDNRCTQHHVLNDFEGERVIQRVTVMGDKPKGANPPKWEPYSAAFSAASWRDHKMQQFIKSRAAS
jgi:taurine dioxygenase